MHPLVYHQGQLAVQAEANTRHVADKLAGWVGPVAEYATEADLVLLTSHAPTADDIGFRFAALSGPAPLLRVTGPGTLGVAEGLDSPVGALGHGALVGGLVVSFETAARARVNGRLQRRGGGLELEAEEAFTSCRKYIAPSARLGDGRISGPASREPLPLDDAWAKMTIASAETSFLASVAPDGAPDLAHRGGPAGFLDFDATSRRIAWAEFVGDGVFKSAGNVRATGSLALLIPDLATGDALEIQGRGTYTNTLTRFKARTEPLVRLPEPFPEQGRLEVDITSLARLRQFMHPRERLAVARVTSRDSPDEQAPR